MRLTAMLLTAMIITTPFKAHDALAALRCSAGLTDYQEVYDLNADGKVTAKEARIILRRSAGFPDEPQTVKPTKAAPTTEKPTQKVTTTEPKTYTLTVTATAYCPCYSCSEGYGRQTASGKTARAKHTVAADTRILPLGTVIYIDGERYVVEDVGGGVRGNHIDIFFDAHSEAMEWGRRIIEIEVEQ